MLLLAVEWLPQIVFVNFVILTTTLFMCKKSPAPQNGTPKEASKKEGSKKEKSKKEGSKKEKSKKEGSKKENSKKEKSKKEEKGKSKKEKEGSKKEAGSKKDKASSKKENKEASKQEEEKEKKKEGDGDKEVDQTKKGSKILDADEHVSESKDTKRSDVGGEAKTGSADESKDGDVKEGDKKEDGKKEEPRKDEIKKEEEEKKDEPKKEEMPKLIVEPKELKFTNPGGKPEILKLNFTNTTGLRLGVKIKCSDNDMFRVNPVFSTVEKDAKCAIEISRNAGNSKPDKLSVVYVEAPPDVKDVATIFKVAQTVAASKIKTVSVGLFHEAAKA